MGASNCLGWLRWGAQDEQAHPRLRLVHVEGYQSWKWVSSPPQKVQIADAKVAASPGKRLQSTICRSPPACTRGCVHIEGGDLDPTRVESCLARNSPITDTCMVVGGGEPRPFRTQGSAEFKLAGGASDCRVVANR